MDLVGGMSHLVRRLSSFSPMTWAGPNARRTGGVRSRRWKYIRNLDPAAEHHTHIDCGRTDSDGRECWNSWVAAARTNPAAAAIVRRYHHRPAEELYDLAADPWELSNLARETAHAATLVRLKADLDAWMSAQGDTGLATERALPDPQQKK